MLRISPWMIPVAVSDVVEIAGRMTSGNERVEKIIGVIVKGDEKIVDHINAL
jgi:hypothetical protein